MILMKKVFLFLNIFLFAAVAAHSQVTIGSLNTPKATLDVIADSTKASKPDGFLPPRLSAAQLAAKNSEYTTAQNGAIVYVTGITAHTPQGKTAQVKKTGFYYYDAYKSNPAPGTGLWVPLGTGNASWFYLPSTKIDVQLSSPNKTLDIFAAYKEQLASTNGSMDLGYTIPSASSPSAPPITDFLTLESSTVATDFYYYVVGYDENVFDAINIDNDGKMHYTVVGTADEATFINIVLVKK
jgi:hypothetical protein